MIFHDVYKTAIAYLCCRLSDVAHCCQAMRNNPMGLLKRDKRHAFSYAFISLCNH